MIALENISGPEVLHNCSIKDLEHLACQLRTKIINTVSETGGHLAPSLGVVELTLALHSTFHSPRDKIIWDVGHQSYAHKLITGRRENFQYLRQYGGLSGFPKRQESPHDVFDTGHSSTSISAALGMALARDLSKEQYEVIAVIGDGALTGGMAFEALNHAGHLGTHLLVILNDNEMSIASNVGALSAYLSRIRTEPVYSKGKEELESILRKLPSIGDKVFRVADRVKDSLKYLVVPGMLFEELGFTYLGPIDGHNIAIMKKVLERAKRTKGPVLIHVVTKKGKGYKPAELNPNLFHGVGPFDITTGDVLKKPSSPSYTEVFGRKMVELGQRWDKLVAITAAMPNGTGLNYFAEKFPDRFFDVGIAEQHAVTLGAGLAVSGFKPVVAIYSTFLQRAFDQVLHDVCMQNLPVLFAVDRAGLVGEDGETHQGIFDLSFLRPIPNLKIMAPKDEHELDKMLEYGLTLNSPVVIRYPRGTGLGALKLQNWQELEEGKSEIIREGKDIVIFAVGPVVYDCLQAAELLAQKKIQATVVNVRFVKPLDEETIISLAGRAGAVVTVEEHVMAGGFGSAVQEILGRAGLTVKLMQIGLPDEFITQGDVSLLRKKYGLDAEGIYAKIMKYWQEVKKVKAAL
ncbi:1-deoxy-D-xylulose-5-phosphate synthase [Zhaonella formicivorans]|uniref:1-deoxy-D-xylulose-5-phosphate synthase n=1 Tax=Zhaonella formicivorans TaxID=2528593 RepID=UPI0010DA8AEB|nr:1-deoxy-D-xylulose-5-phosphate synthase [Zhaonella formicivorans]